MRFFDVNPGIEKNVGWTLVALAACVLSNIMPYLEGRFNSLWAIPILFFPADLLPPLLSLVCCVLLLGSTIRAILIKRYRMAKAFLFLVGLLLLGGSVVLQIELCHRGFTQYARTVLTAEEWREIARYAQKHMMPDGERRSRAETSAILDELESATPFRKLKHSPMIQVRPEETGFYWGGALTGHRYVVVFNHQDGPARQGEPGGKFIAEDIATFISGD